MLKDAASATKFAATSRTESCQANIAENTSSGATMNLRPWCRGARPRRRSTVRARANDAIQSGTLSPSNCPWKSASANTPRARADPAREIATFVSRLILG
jgi:hypothetical protein